MTLYDDYTTPKKRKKHGCLVFFLIILLLAGLIYGFLKVKPIGTTQVGGWKKDIPGVVLPEEVSGSVSITPGEMATQEGATIDGEFVPLPEKGSGENLGENIQIAINHTIYRIIGWRMDLVEKVLIEIDKNGGDVGDIGIGISDYIGDVGGEIKEGISDYRRQVESDIIEGISNLFLRLFIAYMESIMALLTQNSCMSVLIGLLPLGFLLLKRYLF